MQSQIDDTNSVSKILENPGENVISLMHLYSNLDEELKNFLSHHELTTKIFSDKNTHIKFHHLLSGIYSDTPLIVKTTSRKKITFAKTESFGVNSGFFSVTYEDL